MIISADVTRPAATNLQLITGSVLVINGQLNTAGGTLSLQSGASPNVISPTNLNTDVIATTTTLAGPLSLELNGDSAANEYSQLTVEGGINLNGVQLVLSGSYIPPEDTPFVIVDNDGNDAIVGTFMGLSEGAIVTLNGRNLQLSYSGGTDSNDVVLTTLNAEPLASSINEFTDEDTALNGILPVTDPDSSSFTFHVVTPPSSGVVEITNPATGAYTYTPDQDFNGTVNFSYQVNDGVNNSNIATITIVVAPVNDTPQLDFNGGSTTFSAKAARKNGPFRFSPNLNVYDPDNTPQFKIGGGTLTISIDVAVKVTKRATKQLDTIRGLTAASSLGTTSGPVYANGKLTLQVALNANTSAAAVQNFLRNITFSTKGLGLKQQLRTIKIQATDAAGATSPLLQRTINVTR
ncbi:MAG: Ig-like domain-containing protein [Planctomycetota bacterium]